MRVIAGDYRGRKLKSLTGDKTRPTTDKVKGAIFNRIGPYFSGGKVLDLFAGSGALAIEAISRGCEFAVCIDRSFDAIRVIQENVELTKEPEKFLVKKMTADKALLFLSQSNDQFDYIFLDPPYAKQQIVEQIQQMVELNLLAEHAQIICETDQSVELPETIDGTIQVRKRQLYGRTEVVIYDYMKEVSENE